MFHSFFRNCLQELFVYRCQLVHLISETCPATQCVLLENQHPGDKFTGRHIVMLTYFAPKIFSELWYCWKYSIELFSWLLIWKIYTFRNLCEEIFLNLLIFYNFCPSFNYYIMLNVFTALGGLYSVIVDEMTTIGQPATWPCKTTHVILTTNPCFITLYCLAILLCAYICILPKVPLFLLFLLFSDLFESQPWQKFSFIEKTKTQTMALKKYQNTLKMCHIEN